LKSSFGVGERRSSAEILGVMGVGVVGVVGVAGGDVLFLGAVWCLSSATLFFYLSAVDADALDEFVTNI